MKKLTLSLAVLLAGALSNSYAAPFNTNSKFDVKVPCYKGGLTFGLAGLYLQPSSSELDYAVAFPTTGDLNTATFHSVEPDYGWGYQVSLGYVFPGTGNDVKLTYTSLNASTKDSFTSTSFAGTIAEFAPFFDGPISFVPTSAEAKVKHNLEVIDLDAGQHIVIGCNTELRMFGGLRYVDLHSRFDANYFADVDITVDEDTVIVDNLSLLTRQKSHFKGIGPRIGTDLHYNLGSGFGVVGQAASALVIGDINSNQSAVINVVDADTGDVLFNEGISSKFSKERRVVPNLTGKLGLDYSYEFCNPTRTRLTLEAGYLVDTYFNSVDRVNTNGIDPANRARHSIDTTFSGPYVGIQVTL